MANKKRILIVDDEREIALLLCEVFVDEGYEVEVASNAWKALDTLVEFKPHLILSDVMMPIMTGPELIQKIMSMPGFETTKVVFMSAASLPTVKGLYSSHAFARKPFDLDWILNLVKLQLSA